MSIGFSGPLPPARFNMARYCLASSARTTPDKVGLIVISTTGNAHHTETWTYAKLDEAVRRIAGALLNDGLSTGDRLMIRLDNTSDYALLFFGALAAGLVPLPASSMLTGTEVRLLAKDARIAAIAGYLNIDNDRALENVVVYTPENIADMRRFGPLADYADTDANDPAFLVYTSGTTGRPKGVLHAHRSAWGRRPMYRDWYGIANEDRMLHAGAFNWTYTLGTGLTDPWANGATAIVTTGAPLPADWPTLVRKTAATIFAAVPGLYRQILKYAPPGPIDTGNLRHGLTAGETLPPSVAQEWKRRTGTHLCEALGMSEISTYISASPDRPAKPGTIGRAQTGRSITILPIKNGANPVATGEPGLLGIHRSDPALMIDYWNRPDESAEVFRGDWFCGGDLASIDAQGNVTHHGRANDLMNAFGYRVSPREVENVIGKCAGVNEVAVTEINVSGGVNIIVAFVVPERSGDGIQSLLESAVGDELAAYKRPRDIIFVDSLPRTPNGKIRRAELQHVFDARNS